jgi:hypothetical protein
MLPLNVFSKRDETFFLFYFACEEPSNDATNPFEVQGIICVKSLLPICDVYNLIQMKCTSLDNIETMIDDKQQDESYI